MFDKSYKKILKSLFDQQMWCWGCDVRNKDQNYLTSYGLAKINAGILPPPLTAVHGDSVYRGKTGEGEICLSGAAVTFTVGNYTIVLRRFENTFCYLDSAIEDKKCPWCAAITDDQKHRVSVMAKQMLEWIIRYEKWLRTQTGLDYRAKCLESWNKKSVCDYRVIAETWEEIKAAAA